MRKIFNYLYNLNAKKIVDSINFARLMIFEKQLWKIKNIKSLYGVYKIHQLTKPMMKKPTDFYERQTTNISPNWTKESDFAGLAVYNISRGLENKAYKIEQKENEKFQLIMKVETDEKSV